MQLGFVVARGVGGDWLEKVTAATLKDGGARVHAQGCGYVEWYEWGEARAKDHWVQLK